MEACCFALLVGSVGKICTCKGSEVFGLNQVAF